MNERKVILLVEDNPEILWANHAVFDAQGYSVVTAERLSEAKKHLVETPPDVIVLDIMLPDGNALDFIQVIRKMTSAPVLMLTALTEKDDRLAGLRAGGDDYITKPYDVDELLARVKAFLRREQMHRDKPVREITRGSLRLDTVSGCAYLHDVDMRLAPKEFSLLLMLTRAEGEAISTKRLYEEVWRMPMEGDDHPIKNTVYRLRKKLEGSGFLITAERWEGYRLENIE